MARTPTRYWVPLTKAPAQPSVAPVQLQAVPFQEVVARKISFTEAKPVPFHKMLPPAFTAAEESERVMELTVKASNAVPDITRLESPMRPKARGDVMVAVGRSLSKMKEVGPVMSDGLPAAS